MGKQLAGVKAWLSLRLNNYFHFYRTLEGGDILWNACKISQYLDWSCGRRNKIKSGDLRILELKLSEVFSRTAT
jgi:hypothetical protein